MRARIPLAAEIMNASISLGRYAVEWPSAKTFAEIHGVCVCVSVERCLFVTVKNWSSRAISFRLICGNYTAMHLAMRLLDEPACLNSSPVRFSPQLRG